MSVRNIRVNRIGLVPILVLGLREGEKIMGNAMHLIVPWVLVLAPLAPVVRAAQPCRDVTAVTPAAVGTDAPTAPLKPTPRIIHISDMHFSSSPRTLDSGYLIDSQNSVLRSTVLSEYLIRNKAQMRANVVVITGDITDSGDTADYVIAQAFIAKLKSNGFSVYSIPGNHDCSDEGTLFLGQHESGHQETRRENFSKYVDDSTFPRFVDLHDGWLILLDSLQGESATPGMDNCGQGFLGGGQLAQLGAYLDCLQEDRRAGKKVIVCLHHSPFKVPEGDLPPDNTMSVSSTGGLDDAKEFMAIVKNKIDALLFGHSSAPGLLQEGHGSFKVQQTAYQIPMINCENLEHLPWNRDLEFNTIGRQVCMAANQDGRLEFFYIGADSQIWHNWQLEPNGGFRGDELPAGQENDGWHGEEPLGDGAERLCVGENADGRLEIFYVGTDARIRHNWQVSPNGSWHGGEALDPGNAAEACAAAVQICAGRNQDGRLEVFWVGADGRIFHESQLTPNGGWNGGELLDGQAKKMAVGQNQDGRLEIFYIGADSGLHHDRQTAPNGGWHGGEPLERQPLPGLDDAALDICAARNQDGRLEVFYVGAKGEILHNWQSAPNGDWHGEEKLGGDLYDSARQICVGQNKDGHLEIFYAGTNTMVYHNYQTAPNGTWAGEELLVGLREAALQICVARNLDGRLEICHVGTNFRLSHNHQTIPNAAYPITVIDMDCCQREVYNTDSPTPAAVTREPASVAESR